MSVIKIKNKKRSNFKLNKNWVMLVLALLVGGFGIHAANAFIEDQLESYKKKNNKVEKMVKLVVPNRDLPRGIRVSAGDLVVREVPVSFAHKGAVTEAKYTIAINQRLSYPVAEGRPLLWAHLETGAIPTFAGRLPEGTRALSFSVDKISSISGFLQPKDRIDLLLTYKNKRKNKVTRPVIQNLLVLATDAKTQSSKISNGSNGKKAKAFATLTVQVTPEEAKKIILAQDSGKITAVLRHPDDEKLISNKGMTISQLFSDGSKKKGRTKKRQSIEIIIGGVNK